MKISQEDVILTKNLYLSKQYGARRLLSETARQGLEPWKHRQFAEQKPQDGYNNVPQPGSGRPRLSRSSEGTCAQSGGQAKKTSVSSLDFA